MALSKSVIKAQDIIVCDLCESETKLNWKCLNCELLMCNKCCDKIHPKIKNAKHHTIVDIKQVGASDGLRNLDFTNIKCKVHTTQSCCIFCSNCDKLACPSCITKGHAGHYFNEIKKAYAMKVGRLKYKKEKLEMNDKKLDEGEKTLDQISVNENSNCQKTVQDIQHHREALKEEVDKYAIKLIEEVNLNMKSIQESISNEEKNVTTSRQKLKNKSKTAEEILTTMETSFFFENADIIAKSLDDEIEEVNIINKRVPKFKPGRISQSIFGTLFEDISSSNTVIDFKLKKEFTTGLKHCHHISACSDGSLWLGDSVSKFLYKVKPEGNSLTTVITINTVLGGIAVTPNNDFLFGDGTYKLKLVNGKSGKVSDSKFKVEPIEVISVHTTCDNRVMVGAMSSGKPFPVTGRRVVIVMDHEGNHLTVHEQDKHKQRIFSYPWSITTTNNGTIVVVDKIADDWNGKVLILGYDGDILYEYSGCQHIKRKDQPFKPTSITTTASDKVIVIDRYSHFHILDSSGNLLFYYNTMDIGKEHPFCLFFTNSTTFYLGCLSHENSSKAKLYEIQCSGF